MLMEVLPLCVDGVRMSAEEAHSASRTLGNLIIEDWGDANNYRRRNLRYAQLLSIVASGFPAHALLPRLFEPIITRMSDEQFLLEGYENDVVPGTEKIRSVVQMWLCRRPTDTRG